MNEPLVTVLMPVYNAGLYLHECISSILNQSYKNIEFLIVNDGSTDNSADIIASFTDKRIKLLNNEGNKGLVYSLNRGLQEAKGEYIARMDADDIALPERLNKQIAFMAQHPEIGICGTAMKTFGEQGGGVIHKYPLTHAECAAHLLFHTCFGHPTVMFRKKVVEQNNIKYKAEFFPAEDLELWAENVDKIKYANLPEVLYSYRVHPVQTSLSRLESQNKMKFAILLSTLKKVVPDITESAALLYERICFDNFEYTIDFLKNVEALFLRIISNNERLKVFDNNALFIELQGVWFNICTDFASNNISTLTIFRPSPLAKHYKAGWNYTKFWAKNFLITIGFVR